MAKTFIWRALTFLPALAMLLSMYVLICVFMPLVHLTDLLSRIEWPAALVISSKNVDAAMEWWGEKLSFGFLKGDK